MHPLNIVIIVFLTIFEASSETTNHEFGSIESLNRSVGKNLLTIDEAYGPKGSELKITTKVVAVAIAKFEGGNTHKKFAGYTVRGKPLEINRKDADVVLSENHVGLYGSGMFTPKFALVFSDGKEKTIVLLVSPPRPEKDVKLWSLMEAESMKSAPVDEIAGKFLANILDVLEKRDRQSE